MRLLAIALAASFVAAGCGSDGNGGGTINPNSGTWLFVPGSIVDDTCEYADPPTDPSGDFAMLSTGDGTFTVNDGDVVFDCTVSGSAFNCPERLTETIDASPLDAIVSVHVSITGTFSSANAASGRQTANVTCVGADCAAAGAAVGVTFPCSVSETFTATN
ncbi:MAG: hypothetical protein JRG91_06520 [Deltaproteobacteria bacterium]|nr:hypothetical protein [Deltaproteobacteria bacterium]